MSSVQILMAAYNGEEFLSAQIESIINQSYKDWELLISDDCSIDNSLAIIHDFCAKDSRIRVVLEGTHYGEARNHFMALLGEATAEYVMTCDQDDIWDANKIEITLAAMHKAEQDNSNLPLLVCTDLRVVNSDLDELAPSFLKYSGMDATKLNLGYFLASCLVTGCTMMINGRLLKLLQVPVNVNKIIMHDWWSSLVAAAFGRVIYVSSPTISYRQHNNNSVGANRFSTVSALKSLNQKRATERAAIQQASELLRIFNKLLNASQIAQIKAFIAIEKTIPLLRPALMSKADIWRHGILRNLGLLVTLCTLNIGINKKS